MMRHELNEGDNGTEHFVFTIVWIYSYLETPAGQSFNLDLNVVQLF